jgi:carbon monoxide dehydrogenase subunit G
MEIKNAFEVEAPIDHVWAYLLDVTKVAPCMPGAELTEAVNDTTWKGNVTVRLGPVKMGFGGTVVMTERDDAAHHVVLKADGREQRGRGAASALITTDMSEAGAGTKVEFVTDLTITGAAAQYGRGMIQDISSKLTNEFAECLKSNIAAEEAARGAAAPAETASPAAPAAPAAPAVPEAASTTPPAEGSAAAAGASVAEPAPPAAAAPAPAAPPARAPAPAPAARTAKPVGGIRLGLWAIWKAVVRFFRGLFGGTKS